MQKMENIDDGRAVFSQIKEQDKELRFKRRWLMDLGFNKAEAKLLKKLIPPKDKFIPESLIREDDVFYEDIRASIENNLLPGSYKKESYDNKNKEENENYMQLFKSHKGLKDVFSMLDNMTNKGLYSFAEILTSGSIKFAKTNRQMKKLIKKHLISLHKNQEYTQLLHLSEILQDRKNFRESFIDESTTLKNYRDSVLRVLDELKDFPNQTLITMCRKIKGVIGYIPKIKPETSIKRARLIKFMSRWFINILAKLDKTDEILKLLCNVLSIADLTLKLNNKPPLIMEFRKFSSETEALQNEIMKAIRLLGDTNVSFGDLNHLVLLLDPNAKSTHKIRIHIRNMLIEYLLECADIDIIPECIPQALTIINGRSKMLCSSGFSNEELEKEVECVLTVSAQTKQIMLDLCCEELNTFDLEYENAYIEDSLESDDESTFSDDDLHEIECNDETNPFGYESPLIYKKSGIKIEDTIMTEMDSELKPFDFSQLSRSNIEMDLDENKENVKGNKYLAIQEACDRTSMVAYNFIGRTLHELANVQGLKLDKDDVSYLIGKDSLVSKKERDFSEKNVDESMFLRVLDELSEEKIMRPFSDSRRDKLKELMGIK